MKKLILFLILTIGLMTGQKAVGQAIMIKNDTIPFGADSTAVLKLPDYRGNVTWQYSFDKKNWHNATYVPRDSVRVDLETDAWYRAEITDGTCQAVYSDTVIVQNSDTFKIIPDVPSENIHKIIAGDPERVIFNNDTITCVKVGNEYIFQGDIVFSEEEIKLLTGTKGAAIPYSQTYRLWPGGIVYYHIDRDFPQEERATNAIKHWTGNTRLKFIEIGNTSQPNYIEFVNHPEETDSRVGMVGGQQLIRVDPMASEYAVRHEIGHAIGLLHEHCRTDRDKYINVFFDNIKKEAIYNYDILKNSVCLGEFDYVSLMLYPSIGEFSLVENTPTLERKDGVPWLNELVSKELSKKDKAMVEYLYSVKPFVKTADVTGFSSNNAICGGTVYNDGGSTVTDRGICWNTTGNPDINSDNTSKSGSGIGSFIALITDLEPGKKYYVRAYAKNLKGTQYGNQVVFENDPSVSTPTVITHPIDVRIFFSSEGKQDSVRTFGIGQVTDDGGSALTERGVCWNITKNATTADEKVADTQRVLGKYLVKIADFIDYDKQYSLRAFAINKKGVSYGNEIVFTVNQFGEDYPSIKTHAVTAVTKNSATCGGVISEGSVSDFSSRGVFYSTSLYPTVADQVAVTEPGGNGSFTVNITGLEPGKIYYVRAYAQTSRGTLYGSVRSFTTLADGNPTGTFTDSRDGKNYNTVKIGEQWWMSENLAWLPSVSPSSQGSETEFHYYVYDYQGTDVAAAKTTDNFKTYGVLYNWPASMNSCPTGWHLPSDAEWKQLEMALGMTQAQADATGYRGTDQGTQMKTTSGWYDNGNGANSSGFTGLPGGYRDHGYYFNVIGLVGRWWSSPETSTSTARYRSLYFEYNSVGRYGGGKEDGFSVRCIRDASSIPSVTTAVASDITSSSAVLGGNVTYAGNETVTERGVCYGTTQSPTIANNKTAMGSGTGVFSTAVAGLTAGTTYYVRAYATNSLGTNYGEQESFTTTSSGNPTGTFTDSRDGKVYSWVQIGNQVWMAQNLSYLPAVSPSSQGSLTAPYYYVYGYEGTDVNAARATEKFYTYGVLYNRPAATAGQSGSNANPSGVRGVCPEGWHVPSYSEWEQLETFLIANGYNYDGTLTGNKIAKSLAAQTNWNTSSYPGVPGNDQGSNNSTGFSGLPGGVRGASSGFSNVGFQGHWWTSTSTSGTGGAWVYWLGASSSWLSTSGHSNANGHGLRCVRN